MKTAEQNKQEVMTYLEKSSRNFFLSEDGNHYQSVVKIHSTGKYVFVKDGEVIPINIEDYTKDGMTEGKTFLKYRFHPLWNPSERWKMGHGPAKKIRSVKWNRERLELTASAIDAYLKTC
jgi:hypothetical protein